MTLPFSGQKNTEIAEKLHIYYKHEPGETDLRVISCSGEMFMQLKKHLITSGIQNTLPPWLIRLLWFLFDGAETECRGREQVFCLTRVQTGQSIVHTQQELSYKKTLVVPCHDALDAEVCIVDTGAYSIMMLAKEGEEL